MLMFPINTPGHLPKRLFFLCVKNKKSIIIIKSHNKIRPDDVMRTTTRFKIPNTHHHPEQNGDAEDAEQQLRADGLNGHHRSSIILRILPSTTYVHFPIIVSKSVYVSHNIYHYKKCYVRYFFCVNIIKSINPLIINK